MNDTLVRARSQMARGDRRPDQRAQAPIWPGPLSDHGETGFENGSVWGVIAANLRVIGQKVAAKA